LNDLILELSQDPHFHSLLGKTDKAKSGLYKEMRDAEFVLRFFAFRETWSTFSGGMMRHMDSFMRVHQHELPEEIDALRLDFLSTLDAVEGAFGEHAFRRWEPTAGWRPQVLAALFDAEMFACRGLDPGQLTHRRQLILDRCEEFLESIRASTNTPRLFRLRIQRMRALIDAVVS
jgi:hypothetical protein